MEMIYSPDLLDSVFTRNLATKRRQIRQCQYGEQNRKKMRFGKNIYNNIEMNIAINIETI